MKSIAKMGAVELVLFMGASSMMMSHAYEIGCIYPPNMPEPFAAQFHLAEAASQASHSAGVETPVVVYGAHITTYAQSGCIAFHDDMALNPLTKARPGFSTPSAYFNSWSRMMCIAQAWAMLYPSTSGPILADWGFDPLPPSTDLFACQGDPECIGEVVVDSDFDPRLIAQLVVGEIAAVSANDGWNANGAMKFDPEAGYAVPCTTNCDPYADTTGYFPKNVVGRAAPGCRRHSRLSNRSYKKRDNCKYVVKGVNKRWQALLETDGNGYFSRQEHVTPHIGKTVEPLVLDSFKSSPDPKYDYKPEAELVVERLRNLAGSPNQRYKVSFFDQKLIVRGLIQQSMVAAYGSSGGYTFEDHMTFINGISTAEYDATLQAWREKVHHDLVRPTTVIQRWGSDTLYTYNGDKNSTGPASINARDFQVFARVMPHSEYPSGSACLCTAYAEFTNNYTQANFGEKLSLLSVGPDTDEFNTGCSTVNGFKAGCDKTTQFSDIHDMAELRRVCGQSRLWGGMHFTASVPAANELCTGIGSLAQEFSDTITAGSTWSSGHKKGDPRPTCPNT